MTTRQASGSFIDVDEDDSSHDGSSGYGSEVASSTQSLASSFHTYFEENGRRYHTYYGPDKNYMPADEPEKDRLDITHEIARLVTGSLYQAPLDNPQKVLDLGTGTGIWCIDFADENPQAEVTGVDLSPIQPDWVPPNCKFEVDDLARDWTFSKSSYDFIHSRNLLPSIKDVPKFLGQAYETLKPGGHVQLDEVQGTLSCDDNSVPPNWPPTICTDLSLKAMDQIGMKFWSGPEIENCLIEAGFVDVVVNVAKFPYGRWPKAKHLKQAGMLNLLNSETGFHAYSLALHTRVLGMSEADSAKICDEARDAVLYRAAKEKVHQYTKSYTVYARKPEPVS